MALYPDPASVLLYHPFDLRQTRPSDANHPQRRVEQAPQLGGSDARTFVEDGDDALILHRHGAKRHRAQTWRLPDRIVQEVREHPLQLRAVGADMRHLLIDVNDEPLPLFGSVRVHSHGRCLNDLLQVDHGCVQFFVGVAVELEYQFAEETREGGYPTANLVQPLAGARAGLALLVQFRDALSESVQEETEVVSQACR